jgi:CRISPR/Cas system CSM-associated protein Csm2 small subunit
MKNYKEYIDYCQRLAEDVNDSYSDDIDDINQAIHEIADNCQHVIYYAKAWDLVNMMREYHYEKFTDAVDEIRENDYCGNVLRDYLTDINKHMTLIAYTLIRNGIHSAYQHIESELVAS